MLAAAISQPAVLHDPCPVVLFKQFGATSMDFELHFWLQLDDEMQAAIAQSDVREAINELFLEQNARSRPITSPACHGSAGQRRVMFLVSAYNRFRVHWWLVHQCDTTKSTARKTDSRIDNSAGFWDCGNLTQPHHVFAARRHWPVARPIPHLHFDHRAVAAAGGHQLFVRAAFDDLAVDQQRRSGRRA